MTKAGEKRGLEGVTPHVIGGLSKPSRREDEGGASLEAEYYAIDRER